MKIKNLVLALTLMALVIFMLAAQGGAVQEPVHPHLISATGGAEASAVHAHAVVASQQHLGAPVTPQDGAVGRQQEYGFRRPLKRGFEAVRYLPLQPHAQSPV